MSSILVRTAVIPAAGRGTRLAPLTRFLPKELLPVADVPLIEYALREAHLSGIRRIIVVTSAVKSALEEYLSTRPGSGDAIERDEILIVRQPAMRGLGDAVLCARDALANEDFAVLLPDTLFDAEPPALAQLLAARPERSVCLLATQEVAPELVPRSGIIALKSMVGGGRLARVASLLEKPTLQQAPSRYAILGRYVLGPGIFDCLARTSPDASGEVQLTDALRLYQAEAENPATGDQRNTGGEIYAVRIEGDCYDAGDKVGYLAANAAFGLLDPVSGDELRAALGALVRRGRRPARGNSAFSVARRSS